MNSAERLKATYHFQPVDHLYRKEFYIWPEALERWKQEGMPLQSLAKKESGVIEPGEYPNELNELFYYDEPATFAIEMLGWCEPPFVPEIKPKLIESTDKYDIVLDEAGRTVRFLKGKRHGFMPTYLKHAVSCDKEWENEIVPLLDVDTPQRWKGISDVILNAKQAQSQGSMLSQHVIGGYMFLRSLIGPEEVCYMFKDNPSLIHKMMQRWFELAEAVTSRIQEEIEIDEFFLAEDICYNHGLLVSPDTIREFLFPYYQQIIENVRSRQNKELFVQVDTDGLVTEAIDLYEKIGMNVMSPFEIAPGNDPIEIAQKHPNLVMIGCIDKRVLADSMDAIDNYLKKLIPFMVKRGGFIPTCDHGVPKNVPYDNYLYYRKRIVELDHNSES